MTALAQTGRTSTDPQSPTWATKPMTAEADLCPDVIAVARQLNITRPRALRHLQQLYDRIAIDSDISFDFGAYVLAYADPTGETATAHVLAQHTRRSA